jgi:adenylate cyclase class 2
MAAGRAAPRVGTARRFSEIADVRLTSNRLASGLFSSHILSSMASHKEVEIKFRVASVRALARRLRQAGFRLQTRRTHEMNTLYDLPGAPLRKRGEMLRLRKYGSEWVLTHKAKGAAGRHKTRVETETKVADGGKMDAILKVLGFVPSFRYEKFRAEWSDGKGHVVVDETPIGNIGEIEGPARWIDRVAKSLGIETSQYITKTYAPLFFEWKRRTGSPAREMTFKAVGGSARARRR